MSLNIKSLISEDCLNYEFRNIDLGLGDNFKVVTIKEDCVPEIRQPIKEKVPRVQDKVPEVPRHDKVPEVVSKVPIVLDNSSVVQNDVKVSDKVHVKNKKSKIKE